jgi:hypothetical protein
MKSTEFIRENNESDSDVFSDRKRLPPKNLHALLQWAANDPKWKYFRLVANFGIEHNLNLAQTLQTLSDFDAIDDDELESEWDITDEREAMALFNAYEQVYDAWVPGDFDHDNSTMDTWVDESDESDDELFGSQRERNYVVVAPDDEVLGSYSDLKKATQRAKKEISSYIDAGYDSDYEITVIKQAEDNPDGEPVVVAAFPISQDSLHENEAELEEPPERPRKTTTKTKPDVKFDIPFQQDQDHPVAKADPIDDLKRNAGTDKSAPEVNIRKASRTDTLNKTAGIGSDDMSDMLSRLRNIEVDKDLDAYPTEPEEPETLPSTEVNNANLPAVAGQALQAAGVQNPEFHQVANLPGNMADQIRQLGKSLFGSLTMTPTKRIHVIANLGGQGPNTTQEVNAVAGFLKEHGDDRGPGDIDFENVMPGYKAQTHMYTAAGIRWMLVKDFAGQYIYCWPEADSHDAMDAIGNDSDAKQLR